MNRIFTFTASVALATLGMQAIAFSFDPQVKMPAAGVPQISTEVIFDQPKGELSWLSRSCDGFQVEAYEAIHGQVMGSVVQRVDGEDGYVYLSHMTSEYPVNTWIQFEKVDNTLVMEGIQAMYVEYDYDNDEPFNVYLAPMKVEIDENQRGTFVVTDDCKFVFNIGEDGSLTAADPEMLLGICIGVVNDEGDQRWLWQGFGDRDIRMVPAKGETVKIPEGLQTEQWVWKDDAISAFVNVGIDGDDFYISGMNRSLPESWIKGKITDGKVEFPSGQYMGVDMDIYYYSYFFGADFVVEKDEDGEYFLAASLADSAIFDYDDVEKSLTMERGYVINSSPEKLYPLYFYDMVEIGEQHRNPDAAPAAPYGVEYFESDWGNSVWFMLPNVDVDDNILHEENLYYEVIVDNDILTFTIDGVETTLVPYAYDDEYDFWVAGEDHTVYFYTPVDHYVGIRSVYFNENGEKIYSDMAWWGETVGVNEIGTDKTLVSERFYDLQGRELRGSNAGIVVKVATYSDGTVVREKTVMK